MSCPTLEIRTTSGDGKPSLELGPRRNGRRCLPVVDDTSKMDIVSEKELADLHLPPQLLRRWDVVIFKVDLVTHL